MAEWSLDLGEWAAKQQRAIEEVRKEFAFQILSKVITRTPVDTGACRQNWLVSLNQEDDSYYPGRKKGGHALSEGKKVLEGTKGEDTIYIQNNTPYVKMLEYGGYGKANGQGQSQIGKSKQRTINLYTEGEGGKKTEKAEKKSKITADGHSLQTPHGMIGPTLANISRLMDIAIKEVKDE
jgi:hypothetical protein